MKTAILIFVAGTMGWAQIGGYPPRGYPLPYPGSRGPNIPVPRTSKKPAPNSKSKAEPNVQLSGLIRRLDEKSLDLASVDTRFLSIEISEKTAIPKGLQAGDPVRIEATQSDDGLYHAVSVKIDRAVAAEMPKEPLPRETVAASEPAPPEAPAESGTTVVKPAPLYDEDDAGAPKLKRGKPRQSPNAKPANPADPSPATPKAPDSTAGADSAPQPQPTDARQELIAKAKTASGTFLQSLPNFICQQTTTRYQSGPKIDDFRPLDVVSADLVYENGKEGYRNIQVNGKASKKPIEDSGAWSTGEFGTILADLFSPATAADFHFRKNDSIAGLSSSVYNFSVERSNSHWKASLPGQFIQPAYKGSIWVDQKSGRVLRIEMQAREIPKDFPNDAIETAVDYQFVSLGTPEKFLLPVHAEVLACFRGMNACEKNVIEFRNYHKFSGESTIKYNP